MNRSRPRHARRLAVSAFVVAAGWVAGPCGVAGAAPAFDVDAYSACTAAPTPAAAQDFDGFVSTCCVQNAGVPTPTRFGMGCVAAMDGKDPDERPLIVLPTRPTPPEDADADLNGLVDMPLPEPLP